ncbi:hypothetical protein [Erythrobacter aureus]|uniref:hypothetical protein n=1 Tax=Erythrobacter aureus TaxID=2182384 RepID=UPI003A91BB01|tara:strand:- start:300 stop:524 length:225 start_codon:yes stop_codon:yes gene_type:complete
MTMLEKFVAFAQSLPAESRHAVEGTLAVMMASYSDEGAFTSIELDELDRRVAEPNAEYVAPEAIADLLGRSIAS